MRNFKVGDRVLYTNLSTRFPYLLGVPGTIVSYGYSCYVVKFDGHSNQDVPNGYYTFNSEYFKPYIENFIIEI